AGGNGARAAQRAEEEIADVLGLTGEPRAAARVRAREALAAVGLEDSAGARAGTLSAGQRARLTLAIALVCRAALVCLDEPTAHLDETGSALAGDVLRRLRARGAAVLVATHDPAWTAWTADAHLRLARGRLEQVAEEAACP
ncbi:ATP-binding cassette domain-containing protein, partial [Streptomyces caeni]